MTLVGLAVAVLFALGLAGAVLPALPGTPLILAGAVLYAFATDWTPVGPGRLAILTALTAAALALDYAATVLGARRYGATRWGVVGALVGTVAGLALGPLGLIVGPLAGAVAGELLGGAAPAASLRSGIGAVVGVLAGIVAKLVVGLVMIGLFLWWVWRG
jgi:uncharacterized protein YqgC (DUF456 family)